MSELQAKRAEADAAWERVEDTVACAEFFSDEREAANALITSHQLLKQHARLLLDLTKELVTGNPPPGADTLARAFVVASDASIALDRSAALARNLCEKWQGSES